MEKIKTVAGLLLAASTLVSAQAFSCEPLVVGFHGAKSPGRMSSLLGHIRTGMREREGLNVKTVMFGWGDQSERSAERYVDDYRRRCPSLPIVFIGHSYGGDTAFDAAFYNGIIGVPDLLVTLDAVSHSAVFTRYVTGTTWINVYKGQIPFLLRLFHPVTWPISAFGDGCDTAASFGGHWGHEGAADKNFHARARNHCDIRSFYEPAHGYVAKALTGSRREREHAVREGGRIPYELM